MPAQIDILLAVYNNADYLLAQLQSLIHQTYPHFRIIIRDDCSSDSSISLIEKFSFQHPEKILLIKGKRNLGPRGNFSALVQEVRNDYCMFCDADDVWLPTKIEESLSLMQKNEKKFGKHFPLLVHTDLTVVDDKLRTIHPSFIQYSKLNPTAGHALNRLLVQNVITGCTMLINRPLLDLVKPIPEEAIMHDWWVGLVASTFGHIDFLPTPTVLYRQHGKNSVGAKNCRSLAFYWHSLKKGCLSKGRQELRNRLLQTYRQAAQFLFNYRNRLSDTQRDLIQHFATLGTAKALRKRYLFFKYGFFKSSFAKNLGMFFLI